MLSDRIFHWGNLLFLEYGGIINGRVLFIWNFWLMVFLIVMEYYWMTVLEWLIKWYLLDTLSQYPGWIHPGKFPSENLFREITPRRKRLGFFTSPTILYNLFHPGKSTASLIVPCEFLESHWNHGTARSLLLRNFRLNFLITIGWLFFASFSWKAGS